MKKLIALLTALMLLLTALPALADDAPVYNPMPKEIADLFAVPAWEEYHVAQSDGWLSWQYSEELQAGLVVMTDGSLNVVCLIEPNSKGQLRITQRNYTMVLGDCAPMIELGFGNTTQEVAVHWREQWMFEMYNCNGWYFAIGKFDGEWRVRTVLDYAYDRLSFVFSDRIGYLDADQHEDHVSYNTDKMRYAYGVFDNRFEGFNVHDFPRSLSEAREKLTNPPAIPGNFASARMIEFRAGEKYDVFAAPGRSSYRPAKGKAEMSTNDWVQVFGEENGWLLVQYDISSTRMRFGYIDASALPRNEAVRTLVWDRMPCITTASTWMTDDPLNSCETLMRLEAGTEVVCLSSLGTWYYVETTLNGKTVRGFLPMEDAVPVVDPDDPALKG